MKKEFKSRGEKRRRKRRGRRSNKAVNNKQFSNEAETKIIYINYYDNQSGRCHKRKHLKEVIN